MNVLVEFFDREEEVQIAGDVHDLGHDRMLAIDHGEGRRALLAKVHDGLGLKLAHEALHKGVIADVADEEIDLPPG